MNWEQKALVTFTLRLHVNVDVKVTSVCLRIRRSYNCII